MTFPADIFKWHLARGPIAAGGVDDTASLQAQLDLIVGNPSKGLFIADGHYKISAPLNIGTSDVDIVTGLKIIGQSRGGVIIEQMTDNVPIFHIHGQFVHSNTWESMTLKYTNLQVGNAAACVFQVDGPNGGSFYNSMFSDIAASNFYLFTNVPVVAWWGNSFRDMWLGNFTGGVNNISAGVGEPRCTFENLYITGEFATLPLFQHNAVTAWYNNIEVNNVVNGVGMLTDTGGGSHVIGHFALEGATFASDVNLFDVVNSRLLAKYIYLQSLTVAANTTVTGFNSQGGKSTVQCDILDLNFTQNLGQFWCVNTVGPLPCRFGDIFGLSATATLGDAGGSNSLNWVSVDRWNDPARIAFLADANETLVADAPLMQIQSAPMTAARVKTLPQGTGASSTLLFTGRRFKFVKQGVEAFTLTIKDSTGATVATLPSGARGSAEVVWQRSGAVTGMSWVLVSQTS